MFTESDLLSISVPDVVVRISPQITRTVQEGFAARARARKMLNGAKRAVEIAIEKNEADAMAYLDRQEAS